MECLVVGLQARDADEGGPPTLLVAAVVGDLEHAALVEVQAATLAFQTLENIKERGIVTDILYPFSAWLGYITGSLGWVVSYTSADCQMKFS